MSKYPEKVVEAVAKAIDFQAPDGPHSWEIFIPFSVTLLDKIVPLLVSAERENMLDAASKYITGVYGISALSNPIDRERVLLIRESLRAGE